MNKAFITVFTPSYNRAYTLQKLYNSLLRQSCKDFIWYVINDGSTDNTDEVMNAFIAQQKIDIIYKSQKNSGKHYAHNKAAADSETELFLCVDSDDFLTDDAVEKVKKLWLSIPEDKKCELSGIVANRGNENGVIIGTEFPPNVKEAGLSQLYDMGKKGDTALIFRTEIIKQYPFPVFDGERFLREHVIYDEIDKTYKLFVLNEIIYICKYLDDGLSKNAAALEMKSPKGAAFARLHNANRAKTEIDRFRNLTAYLFFSIVAKDFDSAEKQLGKVKTILLLPFTFLGYIRYKLKGQI